MLKGVSRTRRRVLALRLALVVGVLALGVAPSASANNYVCPGAEGEFHCYSVVQIRPGGIELNGSAVHIYTNNDYVPPLCSGKLCDFVTNESWVNFDSPVRHWTEAGDFTGGDFGYETESPTDFAANMPINNSGFGFFVWPPGGPGQNSGNEAQIRYNGGGNYAINFNGQNVFNFGNDGPPVWFEAGMEETDTSIRSEGQIYEPYLYGNGFKLYYWTPGSEWLTPKNLSIICGFKYAIGNRLMYQNFETTSTFGGSSC